MEPKRIGQGFFSIIALFVMIASWQMLKYYDGLALPWPDYPVVATETDFIGENKILWPKEGDQCFSTGLLCTPQRLKNVEIGRYKERYFFLSTHEQAN